jgi:hypothetical protein
LDLDVPTNNIVDELASAEWSELDVLRLNASNGAAQRSGALEHQLAWRASRCGAGGFCAAAR